MMMNLKVRTMEANSDKRTESPKAMDDPRGRVD